MPCGFQIDEGDGVGYNKSIGAALRPAQGKALVVEE